MRSKTGGLFALGIQMLLSCAVLCSGCPGDDDDGDSGGMCFYDCSGEGGSLSGCWPFDTEDECLDHIEESCTDQGLAVQESRYVEGCSMCDECAPSWYDI